MLRFGLLCCLLLSHTVWAVPPLTLDDTTEQVSLSPYLGLLEDPDGLLSIGNLQAMPERFKTGWAQPPDLGYSRSTWWVRFDVTNHSPYQRDWYLLLNTGQLQYGIQVYTQASEASPPLAVAQLAKFRTLAFKLVLPANTPHTVWVRLHNPDAPIFVDATISSQAAMFQAALKDYLFYGIILGGLLALTAYNFVTFIRLREASFLSLSFFILAIGVELTRLDGLLQLIPLPEAWLPALFVFPLIGIASGTSFFYYLMDIPKHLPSFALPFRGLFLLCLGFIPLIPFISQDAVVAASLGAILLVMAGTATFKLYRKGLKEAHSFSWAFLLLMPMTLPIILVSLRIIHYWLPAIDILHLGLLGFMVVLSLTQSERIYSLREQNQRVEAASEAKGVFLTTMSHELRTPMNALMGTGELLRHTPLNPQQQEYLDKFDVAADHLLALVNDILDMARIERGDLPLEQIPFDSVVLLHELHTLLVGQATAKHLHLAVQHTLPAPLFLLGDPTRLKQVLINLLGNAIKFTERGSITLSVQMQQVQQDGNVTLSFAVTDTGVGMSVKQQQCLFQPFSQADSSTARRYGGSGLGLVISQRLVAQMGGKLNVTSTLGQGSCFFFTLAFAIPASVNLSGVATFGKDKREVRTDLTGIRVLLVDDDALNRYFGTALLEKLAVTVSTADTGEAALALLQQQTFDLVMMDVSMPEMDGYTTTRHIRAAGYTDLPIIAVTAHAIVDERERCLAAGMDDFLTKPYRLEDLQGIVCRWLR